MIEGKIPGLCGRPKWLLSFLPESTSSQDIGRAPTLQLGLGVLTSQVYGLLWPQWEPKRWLPLMSSRSSLAFRVFRGWAPDVHQHISAFLPFPVLRLAGSLSRLLLQLQIKKNSQGGILGSRRRWESSRWFPPTGYEESVSGLLFPFTFMVSALALRDTSCT